MSKTAFIGADQGTRRESDFYPTPAFVVRDLLNLESFDGAIWEPASGDGAISKVLEEKYEVASSELRKDKDVYGMKGVNFLKCECFPIPNIKTIFTNPPFIFAEKFIDHSKKLPVNKIVMLLKLSFLEGQKRKKMFADTVFPLKKVYVFSKGFLLLREKITDCWRMLGLFGKEDTAENQNWGGYENL